MKTINQAVVKLRVHIVDVGSHYNCLAGVVAEVKSGEQAEVQRDIVGIVDAYYGY